MALAQVRGRGRQGRTWIGQAGNFFGSTLVELRPDDPPSPSLSLAAGLALIEAVDLAVAGQALMLKWPNDLLLGSRKLAGILLERSGDRVVAGFGVNLAAAPIPTAASLGGAMTPQSFAPLLAASFSRLLGAWRGGDGGGLARAWLDRAHPLGTPLTVHSGPGELVGGSFAGIAPDGAMRLRLADGSEQIVRAGDVEL